MPEEQAKDICVRVALRCRPLISKEIAEGCQHCVRFVPGEPQVVLGKDKAFTYDYAFSPENSQELVYQKSVENLVEGLFKGYNATVLAYGQTGSGKTFSMGNAYNMTDERDMGIIPRVIRSIFKGIEEKLDTEIMLKVSYLEIHKEDIHDLLSPPSKKETLAIREDLDGGIRVAGLCEVMVKSAEDMQQCLERGSVGRTTGSTAMNMHSSRSHAIFTVHMEQRKKDSSESCHAKFHLVDLAGSERAKRTQAEGERFKEGININKGLLALGNVISALGDENGRKSHVPYRDSKLTRLLQDSLGGNSQTVMIACISPADSNMEETLNTLRYADRARRIKNKPIVNRDPHAAELAKLRQQVQQLQIQLLQGKVINGDGIPASVSLEGSADLKTLLERNQRLEADNEKLSSELQASIDQTTQMCEKLILSEMSKDKLKQKLNELRVKADLSLGGLDMTLVEEGEQGMSKVKQQLDMVRELQQKIVELQVDNQQSEKAEELYETDTTPTNVCEGSPSPEVNPSPEEGASTPDLTRSHALRQAALGRELHELNRALALKQELAQKMGQSDEKMEVMKIQYETNIKSLEEQVNMLVKEKENLSHELHASKANSASNKLSEQRRKRLQELEGQIGELKKKINGQSKLIKLKERSDQTVNKLNSEILAMKQTRVRLMKQMKEDTMRFKQWKQAKDKEVMQLKAKDRKRQFEFTRMERQHEKTQNVLRRKMEEASAANKRLREALEKKSAASKLKNQERNLEGMGKRIKSWIDHELEVMVSVNEAKRHLASLLNDRKTLSKEIRQLENEREPPSKKHRGLEELNAEMEFRNVQIADLQQKLMDADNEEKSQSNKWQHITSMPEAKCGIKWLLEAAMMARVETAQFQSKMAELESSMEDVMQDRKEIEKAMAELKVRHEREMTDVQRGHEDKILYLLTQLSSSDKGPEGEQTSVIPDDTLKERLQFQEKQITELKGIHDQLQNTISENDELKKQLTLANYHGKKTTLMPVLTSPEASPAPPPKMKKKKSSAAIPRTAERYTLDELFSEEEMTSDSEFSADSDSDWRETPRVKRSKRALPHRTSTSARDSSNQSCGCKSTCRSRVCGCVKNGRGCGDDCRCDASKCENRRETPSDVSQNGDENTSEMMNTTIVLDSTKSDADTPDLKDFKPPAKPFPKPRKVLSQINGSVDAKLPPKPKLKKENAVIPSRKRSADTLLPPVQSGHASVANLENSGIIKRKRKLLSSNNGSFFKPLDV